MFLMKPAIAVAAALIALAAVSTDADALGRRKNKKIRRSHPQAIALAAINQPAASDCRVVTQTVSHQGVEHTRKARVCQPPSKWADWLARARREMATGLGG